MDAADEMPGGTLPLKKCLDRRLRFGELGSKRLAVSVQSASRTAAVRYSAPVIGGAAAASASSSLSAGAGMGVW